MSADASVPSDALLTMCRVPVIPETSNELSNVPAVVVFVVVAVEESPLKVVVTWVSGAKPVPVTVTVELPPDTEIDAEELEVLPVLLEEVLVVLPVVVVVVFTPLLEVELVSVDGAGLIELIVVVPCGIVVWSSAALVVLITLSRVP